jgi:hypothetical protein
VTHRLLVLLALAAACERKGSESAPSSGSAPAPAGSPFDVNGNAMAPKTVLAATRGGETVYFAISNVAKRTCDALLSTTGVSLESGEILVELELSRPLFGDAPGWTVTRASWPGGVSGTADFPSPGKPRRPTIVQTSDELARKGGTLRVRYDGEFQVGTASPRAWLAIDTTLAVTPCGDLAGVLPPKQPVDVRIDKRPFPIRGAFVAKADEGGLRLQLTSLPPRACERHSVTGATGDVYVSIESRSGRPFVHISGDLVPVQQNFSLRDDDGMKLVPDGAIDGTGPLRVAIDVERADLPITIHGHVDAFRCAN